MGHHRLTIGYLKATVVHIRVKLGHLRVTLGHLRVTIDNFSISKHKANTTELHPKVRQTCLHQFWVSQRCDIGLRRLTVTRVTRWTATSSG